MYAQTFFAYADVRHLRKEHAMQTLCERSVRPQRSRRTLMERPQYAEVGRHKLCFKKYRNVL